MSAYKNGGGCHEPGNWKYWKDCKILVLGEVRVERDELRSSSTNEAVIQMPRPATKLWTLPFVMQTFISVAEVRYLYYFTRTLGSAHD